MYRHKGVQRVVSLWLISLLIITVLSGCGKQPEQSGAKDSPGKTRTIVDQAGRTLTVPEKINKVFSTSPVGSIMVYTLSPDKLAGWNFNLSPEEAKYILPKYRNLPNLGGWYAKNTGNVEELLKIHPDVLINMGPIDETAISVTQRIQKQLNIPVVMVNGNLDQLDQAYEFLGDLLGAKSRAAELGAYCRQTVNAVKEQAVQIPEEKKVRVYYAEGAQGMETEPRGSRHVEVLELVGGANVAEVPLKGGMGMTPVSMEQILSWNPDVIITWHERQGGAYQSILSDPNWQKIKAVKSRRVYEITDVPFNWFDRPPSVNRIIGVKWLAALLYPDIYKYNLAADVKEFYSKFYHYNLSEQELKTLLASAAEQAN